MKKSLIILLMMSLSGCASMQEIRATKPVLATSSDRVPSELAECILQKWQQQSVFNVYIQPRDNGFTVYLDGHWEIADVEAVGKGSKVSLYKKGSMFAAPYKKYTEWVKECL